MEKFSVTGTCKEIFVSKETTVIWPLLSASPDPMQVTTFKLFVTQETHTLYLLWPNAANAGTSSHCLPQTLATVEYLSVVSL